MIHIYWITLSLIVICVFFFQQDIFSPEWDIVTLAYNFKRLYKLTGGKLGNCRIRENDIILNLFILKLELPRHIYPIRVPIRVRVPVINIRVQE